MANLVKWILEETDEADIEGVVIGKMGWGDYPEIKVPKEHQGKLLTWQEAKSLLDYKFCSGFGAPECNAIYVWTKTKIMFIVQYDGSTSLHTIPRNPIACMPQMPGG